MKQIHLNFRAWLVSLAALLAALPAYADVTLNQLEFTEVEGGYSVSAKSGAILEGALVIPDTYGGYPVVEIGERAFVNCSGLTSINIPDAVTTIGSYAFYDCSGLTSINIPDAVTTIGDLAFYYCSGLTSINIPDAVTTIGSSAFFGCSGLTSINIPDAVTTIGWHAFTYCSGLTQIEVSEANTAYCSIDGVVYNKAKDTILCCPGGRQGEFSIPETVTTIGSSAFAYCSGLTSINIPDGVTTIGSSAFSSCYGLTSINIPDAVTTIGSSAFNACDGLTSINIPDAVTTIGSYAFAYCSGLTSINIPDAVTTIGWYAFYGCHGLTSINIPDAVTTIGNGAFSGCSGLTQIEVSEANSAYSSIDGVLYNKAKDTILCCPGGRQGEFSIPETVTTIGYEAFQGCSGLKSINIPDAVTTIGDFAFEHCSGLTSIIIPDAVTTIGWYAFWDCPGLTSVHIGNAVTTIGDEAFSHCSGLTEITCSATTPPNFYSMSFDDSHYAEATVYVPEEAVETYRQDENWSQFQNIAGKILTSVGRIGAANAEDAASATTVYDLRGAKVAASPEGLPRGTYIVRQGGKSKKINVK